MANNAPYGDVGERGTSIFILAKNQTLDRAGFQTEKSMAFSEKKEAGGGQMGQLEVSNNPRERKKVDNKGAAACKTLIETLAWRNWGKKRGTRK